MNVDAGHLKIYDGGSEHAEIIGNLNKAINGTKISTPRNQIFVILHTNGNNNASVRLNATVLTSKYAPLEYCLSYDPALIRCLLDLMNN